MFLSQSDCKCIDDDIWKVWEVFIFFLGSANFRPKCLMNPFAANQDPRFSGMKIVAFTLAQIQSNKIKMKLKGLSNGICLILCLHEKQ